MFGSIAGRTGLIVLTALTVAYIISPAGGRRELGPNDPIAADGSMAAGLAHTMDDNTPPSDSDDPAVFLPLIRADHTTNEEDRALFRWLLAKPLDASLCKSRAHSTLLVAVRAYYSERGRQKRAYALRGPRADAAIQKEWSTALDADIDNYVRHAVQYGLLHKSELPADHNAEFANTVADIEELGTGCTAADNP